MTPIQSAQTDRDEAGRFRPGHSIKSPGNPRLRRLGTLQRALASAITPEELTTVVRNLHDQALAGDTQAARLLLERCLGRPGEERHEIALELPEITDANSLADGMRAVAVAAAAGDIELADAERMVALLREVGEAIVVRQLADRVREIERWQR
jgi:hypothetical protein